MGLPGRGAGIAVVGENVSWVFTFGFDERFVLRSVAERGAPRRIILLALYVDDEAWKRVYSAYETARLFLGKAGVELVLERVSTRGLVGAIRAIVSREARRAERLYLMLSGGPRILVVASLIAALSLAEAEAGKTWVVVEGETFEAKLELPLRLLKAALSLDELEARILGLLSRRGAPMGPSEIARELKAPRSTVYKKLRRLTAAGVLVEENGRYSVSPAWTELL